MCYAAKHLDHAYALTGHAAQGATVERTFVLLPDHGALREWGYVACSRARAETHVYLAERDGIELETPLRDPNPTAPPERAARAIERSSAEPLALDQTGPRHDVHARLVIERQEEHGRQRVRTADRLATAQRELKRLAWWKRGRRAELENKIAFYRTALRLADGRRAALQLATPPAPHLPLPTRGGDERVPTRSMRLDPPGRRTPEQEPPGLRLER